MKEKQHIRKQTLSYRLMVRFAVCMAVLMVLALPLLYLITSMV